VDADADRRRCSVPASGHAVDHVREMVVNRAKIYSEQGGKGEKQRISEIVLAGVVHVGSRRADIIYIKSYQWFQSTCK
jgi:hypothetical protein